MRLFELDSLPRLNRRHLLAVAAALVVAGCGDSSDVWTQADAPAGLGYEETAAASSSVTTAFVDAYQTNTTANTTTSTNAVLNLLSGFSSLWVTGATWDTGTAVSDTTAALLDSNIQGVASVMAASTSDEQAQAYYDDRRDQSYSMIYGLGPLADYFYTGAGATTTITSIPSDATSVKYTDAGTGIGSTSSSLGSVVTLVSTLRGNYSSTTPPKNYFMYPRPWRQTGTMAAANGGTASVIQTGTEVINSSLTLPTYQSPVSVLATLKPVLSTTPASDGGFPSGHTNGAFLAAIALAYSVPERFQELVARAGELGTDRVRAGAHSLFDVMGGRVMATALAAAILNDSSNSSIKSAAYEQAHTYLQTQTGATADTLYTVAHTNDTTRFSDADTNKSTYLARLTNGFSQTGTTGVAETVPKGAEVLLETRLPYLTAAQRRVVLKTTAVDSGYPLLDDTEGWGRLNLVAAADGYGAFNGDVTVTMDASAGGFNASDRWGNDISGAGLLTKAGTGSLTLSGANSYSGGTLLKAGTLVAASSAALGSGDVYVKDGELQITAATTIGARYTQVGGTLHLVIGSGGAGKLTVTQSSSLSGDLEVTFASGYTPVVGDVITVLESSSRHGKFTNITVNGYTAKATYTSSGLKLTLTAASAT